MRQALTLAVCALALISITALADPPAGKDKGGQTGQLPPGLAKQGKVPPGWEKKLQRGRPVPDDLWALRVPVPPEILIKLPPPPPGVITVQIHDRIVRVAERTRELLDEMGLPHP